MIGSYRLMRATGDGMFFAFVAVEAEPGATWSVGRSGLRQNKDAYPYTGFYDAEFEKGVMLAANKHEQLGGEPHRIEIVEFRWSNVDTRNDVVRCAMAVATWKALGYGEEAANVEYENGEWRVTF